MIPFGVSSGYLRLGGNVPGKHVSADVLPPLQPIEQPVVSLSMELGPTHDAPADRNAVRAQGFTGDVCSNCGGSHMQIAGHCQVCADCGTTTGCS